MRRASVVVALGGTLHCGGFSCCRAQAVGMQASVVVVRGLSCPAVCGIFLDR